MHASGLSAAAASAEAGITRSPKKTLPSNSALRRSQWPVVDSRRRRRFNLSAASNGASSSSGDGAS